MTIKSITKYGVYRIRIIVCVQSNRVFKPPGNLIPIPNTNPETLISPSNDNTVPCITTSTSFQTRPIKSTAWVFLKIVYYVACAFV